MQCRRVTEGTATRNDCSANLRLALGAMPMVSSVQIGRRFSSGSNASRFEVKRLRLVASCRDSGRTALGGL